MIQQKIGFIGCGQMARALAEGVLRAGVVRSENLMGSDVSAGAREAFVSGTGGKAVQHNSELAAQCDTLVLAIKPQVAASVLRDLGTHLKPEHRLVSIVAGLTLTRIAELVGKKARLIRVMPNTPCLVGASASGYSLGGLADAADSEFTQLLLSSVGMAFEVPEHLLDAVTGLSGSGPAYVYLMIEALSDGGVRAGLPRDVATKLAAQTLLGGAKMVLETGKHPGELKDMVTSPGGTTIAGLATLERQGLRSALIEAVSAAAKRATELASS